jgi:23S rRNA (cytidine1920-2'-O)/16S rRNA (cytidine1409-2'-O)-methyltransferase
VAANLVGLMAPGGDLIVLVKPQFELGPAALSKGGRVRDPAARQGAVEAVRAWLEAEGWVVKATAESPVLGGEGAVEHLLWACKP